MAKKEKLPSRSNHFYPSMTHDTSATADFIQKLYHRSSMMTKNSDLSSSMVMVSFSEHYADQPKKFSSNSKFISPINKERVDKVVCDSVDLLKNQGLITQEN